MTRLSDSVVLFALFMFTFLVIVSKITQNPALEQLALPNPFFHLGLLVFHAIMNTRDKRITIPFERENNNRTNTVILTLAAYAGFIILTPLLAGFIITINEVTPLTMMGVFLPDQLAILGQETVTLANNLASSALFVWAIYILFGVIETLVFFGSGLEFILDRLSGRAELKAGAIMVVLFSLFHIFTKNIVASNGLNLGLIATVAFGIISVALVFKQKQLMEAAGLHALTNGVAGFLKLKKFGLL